MNLHKAYLVIALSLIPILATAAQQSGTGNWTSFILNNNNTRYVNSTINSTNVGSLISAWNITTYNSVTSTPLVQNGNVYFVDWGGYLWSANIVSGSINWKENLGAAISSTPLLYNNTIYVALGPSGTADVGGAVGALKGPNATAVFALNEYDGSVRWITNLNKTTHMDAIWGSPIIYKNMLYVGVASQGDESERAWKGALYGIYANNGVMAWNTLGSPNSVGYGSILLGGPDGGDGMWGSVVVDPALNEIYFGTGNPYTMAQTVPSVKAKGIKASNSLTLYLSGQTSWISPSNPLLVSITGDSVGAFSTSSSVLATDSGKGETQTFLVTSGNSLQVLSTNTGNFYYITQVSLNSPNNPRQQPNPSVNGIVTETYLSSLSSANSISASSYSENSLYGYSIVSLNATNGKMVWYNQVCKAGLYSCGDADFGSTPNLFSISASLQNCTLGCNAIGLGSKDGNYYVLNRINGNFIERLQVGSSEDYIYSDGGIVGLAGMTNTTDPHIFVPSYYNPNGNNVGGIVRELFPANESTGWSYQTKGIIDGSVTVIPGAVLFGDTIFSNLTGYLYAVSAKNGSTLLKRKLSAGSASGITVSGNYVLATGLYGSSNSMLGVYAFKLPNPTGTTTTTVTSTSTSVSTTIPPINQTLQEISALQNSGFTNITLNQNIAVISSPASMFFAFDKNAYGANIPGNVLIFALPLGYEYQNWNMSSPTTYSYWDLSNALHIGTINFESYSASYFFGGIASGIGKWITWKEIVPSKLVTLTLPTTSTTTMTTSSTSTPTSTSTSSTTAPSTTATTSATSTSTTSTTSSTTLSTTATTSSTSLSTTMSTTASTTTTASTSTITTTATTTELTTVTTSIPTTTTATTTATSTSSTTSSSTITTSSTSSSTTSTITTTIPQNTTVQQMISALQNQGFTNITATESVASITSPAVMFFAFDKNAYGTGSSGNVLIYVLPLGDQYIGWTDNTPTIYSYYNTSNVVKSGSIIYNSIPASGFYGGIASGAGLNWINWKELVPSHPYQSLMH